MKELTLTESEKIAAIIGPIMNLVDIGLGCEEDLLDMMKRAKERMEESTSMLEAFPFPATMNKGHEQRIKNEIFGAVVNLFQKRKEAIEKLKEGKPFAGGEEILKMLGME